MNQRETILVSIIIVTTISVTAILTSFVIYDSPDTRLIDQTKNGFPKDYVNYDSPNKCERTNPSFESEKCDELLSFNKPELIPFDFIVNDLSQHDRILDLMHDNECYPALREINSHPGLAANKTLRLTFLAWCDYAVQENIFLEIPEAKWTILRLDNTMIIGVEPKAYTFVVDDVGRYHDIAAVMTENDCGIFFTDVGKYPSFRVIPSKPFLFYYAICPDNVNIYDKILKAIPDAKWIDQPNPVYAIGIDSALWADE